MMTEKKIVVATINDPEVMKPDYPHKVFNDKRSGYFLLMEALAMDAARC